MLWIERRAQLIREGRWYQDHHCPPTHWKYPNFLGLFLERDAPLLTQARRETCAPVRLSEEPFPDQPLWVALYLVAPADLQAFWTRYKGLKCEAEAAAYGGKHHCIQSHLINT